MKFTAEDFKFDCETLGRGLSSDDIANRANARLAEMLKDAPVVFSFRSPQHVHVSWTETRLSCDTHRAKLVCVEGVE